MKRFLTSCRYFGFILCLIFSELSYSAEQSLLIAAQAMIRQGQALDALELLQPFEEDYAGEKEFDYLYGLALLDTGESASSIFAFQRALAVEPNFAGARLELARAYYDMGQMQRAQREFLILESQAPPENILDIIQEYLAAIESRNLRDRRGWSGYLQLGLGNDSNVNSATASDEFLGFQLTDESQETGSSVISTVGGVSYDLPLDVVSKLFFRANVSNQANTEASFTSSVNFDLLAGYNRRFKNNDEMFATAQIYSADVDGEFNNEGLNLFGQYNINLSTFNQIGLFARSGYIDYDTQFDVKDVDQTVFGTNWVHVFSGSARLSMVAALLLGEDVAKEPDSPYGRDFTGYRVSLAYPLSHRVNLFVSAGVTDSDYDGEFFGSPDKRSDSVSDFGFGASWRVNKTWMLRAILGRSENSSNVDLYTYDRDLIMFTARSELLS